MASSFVLKYPNLRLIPESSRNPADQVAACQYLKACCHDTWVEWFSLKEKQDRMMDLFRNAPLSIKEVREINESFWLSYTSLGADGKDRLIASELGSNRVLWLTRKALDLYEGVKAAKRRFAARHSLPFSSWYNRAEGTASFIARALSASDCTIIGRRGPWLFGQGIVPSDLGRELIVLDHHTLLKVPYKGDYQLVFKERGRFHGIRLDLKKPSHLTLHEAHHIAGMLDAWLDNDACVVARRFREGLDGLNSRTVALEDVLFRGPEELTYLGVAVKGDRVFLYAERDKGLEGFDPHWKFYQQRFRRVVGKWLCPYGKPQQRKLF